MNLGFPTAVSKTPAQNEVMTQLHELSHNYAWTWNKASETLFETLSPQHWRTERNPIKMIRELSQEQITAHRDTIATCHAKLQETLKGVRFENIQKENADTKQANNGEKKQETAVAETKNLEQGKQTTNEPIKDNGKETK